MMDCTAILKEKGLKMTSQRRLIIDLINEADNYLTAEEIITFVQNKIPKVHKTTIYRTLQILEEFGYVFRSEFGNFNIYHHSKNGNHYHLVCRKCGKTIDCDEDLFTAVERSQGEKYNFQIDSRHMVMSGLCEECVSKKNNRALISKNS